MSGRVERKANNMHKEDGSETEIQKELITIKGIVDGMTSREYLNRETSAAEDQKKKEEEIQIARRLESLRITSWVLNEGYIPEEDIASYGLFNSRI